MNQVITVTDESFRQDVLQESLPTLVDFYADWCGPCRAVAPVVEEVAQEFAGRVKVAKVNVDGSGKTAQQYAVLAIPTLILFENGKEVKRFRGFMPKAQLSQVLSELVPATQAGIA